MIEQILKSVRITHAGSCSYIVLAPYAPLRTPYMPLTHPLCSPYVPLRTPYTPLTRPLEVTDWLRVPTIAN